MRHFLTGLGAILCAIGCERAPRSGPSDLQTPTAPEERYAGSTVCRECHVEQYRAWATSHHALAERTVQGDIDDDTFAPAEAIPHGSFVSQVRQREGRFEIVTVARDGQVRPFPVARLIGRRPLRQLLVPADGGRWQVSELAFDPQRGEWFDVFGEEDRRPGEWGHWTGRGMTWNSMCADCHNTDLRKGYDDAADAYCTTRAEMGVGCEACHGPGEAHIEWQRRAAANSARQAEDPSLATLRRTYDPERVIDVCAACHSRRSELRERFMAGEPFLDSFLPVLPDRSETWYADGQVREENYEYASFRMSRMYVEGVQCRDCHEPHAGTVRQTGNDLCLRCHGEAGAGPVMAWPSRPMTGAAPIDPAAHSFHDVTQPGGQCVNCHMPVTVYMQRHPRRDHGFSIPDPLLTRQFGLPNACNRCHTDRDVEWALQAVERWYGQRMNRPTRARAQLIARVRRREPGIERELLAAVQSEAHPTWRAILAGLLDEHLSLPPVRGELIRLLGDDDALVRLRSAQTLRPVDGAATAALRRALNDPLRAVRVAAAASLGAAQDAGHPAVRELREYLEHNADQPGGVLLLAQFLREHGQAEQAVARLQRAIGWQPDADALHYELGVTLSQLGRPREAARAVERACQLSPQEPQWWFGLGLARAEAGEQSGAIEALRRACELDPRFTRAWYNLALLQNAGGERDAALTAIERVLELEPENAEYWFTRAVMLRDAGRHDEARDAARQCLRLAPDHAEAMSLLASLEGRPKRP